MATYDEERRSIFVSTADEFIKRLINDDARLVAYHDPVKDAEGFERAWNRFAIDSNLDVDQYCPHYSGSSIVVGGDKGSGASGKHAFEARAGEHLYPARLSDDLTIVDILGDDIGVILTGLSEVEIDDCRRSCMQSSIPCSVHAVQQTAETSRWKAGVIVVRPDHFVAFASKDVPRDLCAVIRKVVGS